MPQIIGPSGGIQMTVDGIAQLEATFKTLERTIQRKVLVKAARAAGNAFLRVAKLNAPVNTEDTSRSKRVIAATAKKIETTVARKIYRRLAKEQAKAHQKLGIHKQAAGTLKRSIKLRKHPNQKRNQVRLAVQTGTRAEMDIPADSKWYYPAHVEYGHGFPGEGPGKKSVRPHPFMRPAYDSTKNYAKHLAETIMRDEVEKEALAASDKTLRGPV